MNHLTASWQSPDFLLPPAGALLCRHSPDFYNSITGTFLTGTCSQFKYANRSTSIRRAASQRQAAGCTDSHRTLLTPSLGSVNVPMLVNEGQFSSSYHPASVSVVVTLVTYVSFPAHVTTAFCGADLYRVSFSPSSFLDFCFGPVAASSCRSNNCPTAPFVNYANFRRARVRLRVSRDSGCRVLTVPLRARLSPQLRRLAVGPPLCDQHLGAHHRLEQRHQQRLHPHDRRVRQGQRRPQIPPVRPAAPAIHGQRHLQQQQLQLLPQLVRCAPLALPGCLSPRTECAPSLSQVS